MKFRTTSKDLLHMLSLPASVVDNNPVIPICSTILFRVDNERLHLTATNMGSSANTYIDVEDSVDGSSCVPAQILVNTLKALPEQDLVFEWDNTALTISGEKGIYNIACELSDDFPEIDVFEPNLRFALDKHTFDNVIAYTANACSADMLRPQLNGVNFSIENGICEIVGTDAHVLSRYRVNLDGVADAKLLIPATTLQRLSKHMYGSVTIESNGTHAKLTSGANSVLIRMIDKDYVEYQNIIPERCDNTLTVNRADLIKALDRVGLYSNVATNSVAFNINGELEIASSDLDFGNEAAETLQCKHNGDDMKIFFNNRFVKRMLVCTDSEDVEFSLLGERKPVLIHTDDESLTMLVMPVIG